MKKCENGHFYNPDTNQYCPYCPKPEGANSNANSNDALKTSDFKGNDGDKTEMIDDGQDAVKTGMFGDNQDAGGKTDMFDGGQNNHNKTQLFDDGDDASDKTDMFDEKSKSDAPKEEPNWNKTYIGMDDDDEESDDENPNSKQEREAPRAKRKLVGWLVSFTMDELGIDFRLYEGRNTIGSAPDNEITVSGDRLVSSKHATVLFRKNKFRLKDEFSTNGTFLNNEDLDDEVLVLKDGDTIKVGDTLLKFRSAL